MKKICFEEADNLSLKTFSFENETITSENDIIRNLKDENGRLMKLVQEKDFEINKIKRVSEKQNVIRDNLSEGAASLKIIELSKKLRESNAECESWKTRYYQRDKEAKSAVNATHERKIEEPLNQPSDASNDLKAVKEKLKTSESKVLELLTSNQNLSRELKMAMKVLESELGDANVDVTRLLSNPGQWRGRAQKIVALKDKVDHLERQLKEDIRPSGATSLGMLHSSSTSALIQSPKTRQGDVLARIQRERQISADKMEEEHRRLTAEHERVKQTSEGLRSRNKCLSEESKSYRLQIKNMLDKTKNDDELIGSLILQQDRLKNSLQSVLERQQSAEMGGVFERVQATSQGRQDRETVDKLREIVAAKDAEIRQLRDNEGVVTTIAADVSEFNVEYEQLKISTEALVKEVSQLRCLVGAEEERLEALLHKNMALSEENSRLRQTCLRLEREVQKVAPNSKAKSKAKLIMYPDTVAEGGGVTSLLGPEVAVTRDTVESLQDEVCLRTDKIESLKTALDMMSAAKKDDMKMLTDIIDQTRNQFLDSIKKIKTQYANKDS